jgi:hypothetical protein
MVVTAGAAPVTLGRNANAFDKAGWVFFRTAVVRVPAPTTENPDATVPVKVGTGDDAADYFVTVAFRVGADRPRVRYGVSYVDGETTTMGFVVDASWRIADRDGLGAGQGENLGVVFVKGVGGRGTDMPNRDVDTYQSFTPQRLDPPSLVNGRFRATRSTVFWRTVVVEAADGAITAPSRVARLAVSTLAAPPGVRVNYRNEVVPVRAGQKISYGNVPFAAAAFTREQVTEMREVGGGIQFSAIRAAHSAQVVAGGGVMTPALAAHRDIDVFVINAATDRRPASIPAEILVLGQRELEVLGNNLLTTDEFNLIRNAFNTSRNTFRLPKEFEARDDDRNRWGGIRIPREADTVNFVVRMKHNARFARGATHPNAGTGTSSNSMVLSITVGNTETDPTKRERMGVTGVTLGGVDVRAANTPITAGTELLKVRAALGTAIGLAGVPEAGDPGRNAAKARVDAIIAATTLATGYTAVFAFPNPANDDTRQAWSFTPADTGPPVVPASGILRGTLTVAPGTAGNVHGKPNTIEVPIELNVAFSQDVSDMAAAMGAMPPTAIASVIVPGVAADTVAAGTTEAARTAQVPAIKAHIENIVVTPAVVANPSATPPVEAADAVLIKDLVTVTVANTGTVAAPVWTVTLTKGSARATAVVTVTAFVADPAASVAEAMRLLASPRTIVSLPVAGGATANEAVKAAAILAALNGITGMDALGVTINTPIPTIAGTIGDGSTWNIVISRGLASNNTGRVTVTEFVAPG